jgi:hypothetical protein
MRSPIAKPRTRSAEPRYRAKRLALFGRPPLIEGENSAAYDELLGRISAVVKPTDILEHIWLQEVVDLVWEILRLRRLKANLMAATAHQGLERVLKPLLKESEILEILPPEVSPKPGSPKIQRPSKRWISSLRLRGLSVDAVMARTLSVNLDVIERIDRLITIAEARHNAALRELDRHRAVLGQDLRGAALEVEDAKFKVIQAKPPSGKNAA